MANTKNYININGEHIPINEEFGRSRCGFLYYLEFNNDNKIYIDLNHKLNLGNSGIVFEKNKDFDGNEWDYAKSPFEDPVIHYYPYHYNNIAVNNLINIIRKAYIEQEKKWKINCKKQTCNNCMACDS